MAFVPVFSAVVFYFLNKLFVGSLLLYVEYFRNCTSVLSVFLGSRALRCGFVFIDEQDKKQTATNQETSQPTEGPGTILSLQGLLFV